MLTLDSIIAATKQMTAFGEGAALPVPRDKRPAQPKSSEEQKAEPDAKP